MQSAVPVDISNGADASRHWAIILGALISFYL